MAAQHDIKPFQRFLGTAAVIAARPWLLLLHICISQGPLPVYGIERATATFWSSDFAGSVLFSQENISEVTTVTVVLSTTHSSWQNAHATYSIHQNNSSAGCAEVGDVYDPDGVGENSCALSTDKSRAECPLGDLTGKHGELKFANGAASTQYTDSFLPLDGECDVRGRTLAVYFDDYAAECVTIYRNENPLSPARPTRPAQPPHPYYPPWPPLPKSIILPTPPFPDPSLFPSRPPVSPPPEEEDDDEEEVDEVALVLILAPVATFLIFVWIASPAWCRGGSPEEYVTDQEAPKPAAYTNLDSRAPSEAAEPAPSTPERSVTDSKSSRMSAESTGDEGRIKSKSVSNPLLLQTVNTFVRADTLMPESQKEELRKLYVG
ncbi:hypothetical protein CYMTET_10294 [Cymbomonas tetramitiformis]|uniref:Uncharacterized protein n=1 Tax=Cymbomonas tetramitiformis TaxID=36881 RepID=A0AAE0LAS3_9CHLO|nr:hypothetical protein CYMTET_13547 [Cymbomonas tetramitiformis]KAK3281946.1 hypothetical protein CYMTET_10294 [Cymbomonas tetramitiformis]